MSFIIDIVLVIFFLIHIVTVRFIIFIIIGDIDQFGTAAWARIFMSHGKSQALETECMTTPGHTVIGLPNLLIADAALLLHNIRHC
jgi:hypothetical protein